MDLQTFVEETISQIASGVKNAQSKTNEHGARINPHLSSDAELSAKNGILIASGEAAQLMQFDVALTVSEGSGTKGGIGVSVGAITLGSAGQSNNESSSMSRVKFVVPIVLPKDER